VNACLDRVNELITTATSDLVTREDLATLTRLQEEFAAELATLRASGCWSKCSRIEKLSNFPPQPNSLGSLLVAGIVTGENADGDELDDSTVLVDQARLELNTSFTGEDLLFTRLATGNFAGF